MKVKKRALLLAITLLTQPLSVFAGAITLGRANKKAQQALNGLGGITLVSKNIKNLARNGRLTTEQLNPLIERAKNLGQRNTTNDTSPRPSQSVATQTPISAPQPKPSNSSEYTYVVGNTTLVITKGDITTQKTHAIVNAANSHLLHGAGIAGAIKQAAGQELQPYSDALIKQNGPIKVGEVVETPAFNLSDQGIKNIIHAVGPDLRVIEQKNQKAKLLASAYRNSLDTADRIQCKSIAFPSISTGIFGYNVQLTAPIAVKTVLDYICQHNDRFTEVRFVLYTDEQMQLYKKAVDNYKPASTQEVDDSETTLSWFRRPEFMIPLGLVGFIGLVILGAKLLNSHNNNTNNSNNNNNGG